MVQGKTVKLSSLVSTTKTRTLQPLADWKSFEVAPKLGEPYEQTLDLKRGILTTKLGNVVITALVYGHNIITNVKGSPSKDGSGRDEPDGSWSQVTYYTDPATEYAKLPDWLAIVKSQEAAWTKRWEGRDIIIEGDPEAQQLVHKLMFDLMQSVGGFGSHERLLRRARGALGGFL